MRERHRALECSLVDLTQLSVRELARLDDELLEDALRRLLHACGGGARLWNLNVVTDPPSQPPPT
jgi:hypothetical protein